MAMSSQPVVSAEALGLEEPLGGLSLIVDNAEPAAELADYGTYREICDTASDSFRKIGILTVEGYENALQDPNTVTAVVDGVRVPIIAPVKHEHGYDAERCAELIGKEAMFLTVPLSSLTPESLSADSVKVGEQTAQVMPVIIAEELPLGDASSTAEISHTRAVLLLSRLGAVSAYNFLHKDIPDETNKKAWMGLYDFSIAPEIREGEGIPAANLDDAWRDFCDEKGYQPLPDEDSTGVFLLNTQFFRDRPEVLEELWKITETGFGKKILGAYHPVSMEEGGKEAFEELLLSNDTYTMVRYQEGKPVCFGTIGFDLDSWTWVDKNSKQFQDSTAIAEAQGETPVYFSALISDERGMGHAPSILKTFFQLASRTQQQYRVIFESTNLSSIYIPSITEQVVAESELVSGQDPVRLIGKIAYWYALIDREAH
jgi:hypothetical protein